VKNLCNWFSKEDIGINPSLVKESYLHAFVLFDKKIISISVTNVHCCQSKEENMFIERRMSSMQRTISYLREELRCVLFLDF